MPFKSKAQEKFLYANHPEVAKQFQAETPNDASLPDRISKKSDRPRRRRTSDRDYDRGMLHSSETHKAQIK